MAVDDVIGSVPSLVYFMSKLGGVVERVRLVVDDLADSRVDDHLGALQAGSEGRVEGGVLDADPVVGGLGDGVFLAVGTQALVESSAAVRQRIAARAPPLIAVPRPPGGSVVAG